VPRPPAVPAEIEFEAARLALSAGQRAAIWKPGWGARGKVLDRIFRQGNLHDLSRTIDDFVGDIAISSKSVDLNAATYQDFRRLLSRVNRDLEKLESYSGTGWGGDMIYRIADCRSRAPLGVDDALSRLFEKRESICADARPRSQRPIP
jgi:hypothetical protein